MANYKPEINITSEEINALIYSYLQDSGFTHSAFLLRQESRLDKTPYDSMTFRRGLLTELLAKALIYTEVEMHWKQVPGSCNAPFSILQPHECTYVPRNDTSALAVALEPGKNGHDDQGKETDDEEMIDSTISKLEIQSSYQMLLKPDRGEVFVTSWNPVHDGMLATGSKDGWVHIWQIENEPITPETIPPRPLSSIRVGDMNHKDDGQEATCLDWSRDGNLLAIGSNDPRIRVWSRVTGKLVFSNCQQNTTIAAVRFSPSGKFLLSASLDGTVVLWDIEKNKVQQKYESGSDDVLPDVAWINDTSFATSWIENQIHVFVISSSYPFRIFRGHTGEINQIRITGDRKLLASVSDDRTAKVWTLEPLRMTWKSGDVFVPVEGSVGGNIGQGCLHTFSGHTGMIQFCKWVTHPSENIERLLVTTSDDFTARLWDAKAGTCLKVFSDHKNHPYGILSSPDNRFVATAAMDGWLYIYSLETLEMVNCWKERTDKTNRQAALYEADWSRDGRKIASGMVSGHIAVIDVSHLRASPNITITAPRA